MLVVKEIPKLKELIEEQKSQHQRIGFVPTMGALHAGHLSLINEAGKNADFVVVSIFVNPTQFNNHEDLDKYPRDLDKDVRFLKNSPCQLLFVPEVETIYPEQDTRKFEFGSLESVMEGRFRPGHFNGVAQVVSKLLQIVGPDKAFFGLKDFQQLVIIKSLVKQLTLPVEIIPCPIVREADGLAMSSRNKQLSESQRKSAPYIHHTLQEAGNHIGQMDVEELKNWVISSINANDELATEYFEIVDDEKLRPVTSWDQPGNKVGCIAVYCGKVRLIDNWSFNKK